MQNIQSLIMSLIQSFALGYLTYYFIKSSDILIFTKNEQKEKIALITTLSVINQMIYFLIDFILRWCIQQNNIRLESIVIMGISILLTTIVSVLLGMYFYPKLFILVLKIINKKRKNNGKLEITFESIRDKAFDNRNNDYVYIFTLEGVYIASGYIDWYQHNYDESLDILLTAPENVEACHDVETVEKLFKTREVKILVDVEHKLKIYIVPMD